ncbi:putative uncharacterized protein DDB_G0282133 isoform X2 [Trichogramma pretiosum]|uniref:putative uncharacterized protein DDB_G0282133 isoform X2 n=1 Tax=Trichogramma pretiosum TaxID=7493 RepID=UPI000C718C23|nr:putative uncharacterized protein DDB_G0282133 isoform X2 [Trichogramma pretiosum]
MKLNRVVQCERNHVHLELVIIAMLWPAVVLSMRVNVTLNISLQTAIVVIIYFRCTRKYSVRNSSMQKPEAIYSSIKKANHLRLTNGLITRSSANEMDSIAIEAMPSVELILNSNLVETSDLSEKKDNLSLVDEDDIHLVVTDDEEIEQETNNSIDDIGFDVNLDSSPDSSINIHNSNNNTVNKEYIDKSCEENLQNSKMKESDSIAPFMRNTTTRLWSNNVDNRWKGNNQSRNRSDYHHQNNRYNYRYPERNRFNSNQQNYRNNYRRFNNNPREKNYDTSKSRSDSTLLEKSNIMKTTINENSRLENNGLPENIRKTSEATNLEKNVEKHSQDKSIKNDVLKNSHQVVNDIKGCDSSKTDTAENINTTIIHKNEKKDCSVKNVAESSIHVQGFEEKKSCNEIEDQMDVDSSSQDDSLVKNTNTIRVLSKGNNCVELPSNGLFNSVSNKTDDVTHNDENDIKEEILNSNSRETDFNDHSKKLKESTSSTCNDNRPIIQDADELTLENTKLFTTTQNSKNFNLTDVKINDLKSNVSPSNLSPMDENSDQEVENNLRNEIDSPSDLVSKSSSIEDIEVTDESSKSSTVEPFKEDKGNESDEKQKSEKHKRKKRKKATAVLIEEAGIGPEFDEGVRHKRRSAKYAEEMIRKEIQNQDDDSSQDDNDTKEPQSNALIPASAPTLPAPNKRNQTDIMDENLEQPKKRIKTSTEKTDKKTLVAKQSVDQKLASNDKVIENVDKHNSTTNLKVRELVKQISQEDVRKKFKLMTREEMEALCIQKVTECLTNRGEIGKLRDEVRQAQLANESLKGKAITLLKMCTNFESVLTRINQDRLSQAGKFQPPIKINRSVGLQVNLNLKTSANASLNSSLNSSLNTSLNTSQTPNKVVINQRNFNSSTGLATLSPRKTIKTRSPRTVEITSTTTTSTIINPATTTTPVVTIAAKPTSTESGKRNFTLQQVLLNTGPIVRQNPMTLQKNNSKKSDLIDLTDEEDKNNTTLPGQTTSISAATAVSRYPRVIQAVPASVAITTPNSGNVRLVQAGSGNVTSTIVNAIGGNGGNVQRVAYLMHTNNTNGGPARQLVFASNNTVQPTANSNTKNAVQNVFKQQPTGSTQARLVSSTGNALQIRHHPAPLPEIPPQKENPKWKLIPPAPTLKISKVTKGIVLSWNMNLSDKYEDIVSYQLFAYQEVTGTAPSTNLWKKVGDVRALPLPMACTLTQFTEGNSYHFAVRAVDFHSRFGQYSKPAHISL